MRSKPTKPPAARGASLDGGRQTEGPIKIGSIGRAPFQLVAFIPARAHAPRRRLDLDTGHVGWLIKGSQRMAELSPQLRGGLLDGRDRSRRPYG